MRHLRTLLTVLGAVTVLVLASNTVVIAATGQGFILGKGNSANSVTTLKRTTSGSVLKLQPYSSSNPPMAVTGTGKVVNLNADKIDGYDSVALLNQTRVYKKTILAAGSPSNGFQFHTGTVPAGDYLLNVSGWIYGPTTGEPGIECYVQSTSPSQYREWFSPTNAAGYYTLAIGGVLSLPTAQTLEVNCSGPPFDYNTFGDMPITVALTRIGQLVNGSVAARVKPDGARSATR